MSLASASSRFWRVFSSSKPSSRAAIVARTNGATPAALADIHAAIPGLPLVDACVADTVLAAQIGHGPPRLVLFQNAPSRQIALQSPAGQWMTWPSVNLLRFISVPFGWARVCLKPDQVEGATSGPSSTGWRISKNANGWGRRLIATRLIVAIVLTNPLFRPDRSHLFAR